MPVRLHVLLPASNYRPRRSAPPNPIPSPPALVPVPAGPRPRLVSGGLPGAGPYGTACRAVVGVEGRRVSPQWHVWVDSLPPKGAIGWKPSEGDVAGMRRMSASDDPPTRTGAAQGPASNVAQLRLRQDPAVAPTCRFPADASDRFPGDGSGFASPGDNSPWRPLGGLAGGLG